MHSFRAELTLGVVIVQREAGLGVLLGCGRQAEAARCQERRRRRDEDLRRKPHTQFIPTDAI